MIRIIIADDEPLIRSSLTKKIDEYGNFTGVCGKFATGKITLSWLDNYFADICVTDINMPGMDGLNLIEKIRKECPWMRFIVISGYNEFKYAKRSISLGVDEYILKPIDQTLLHQALERTCSELANVRRNRALNSIINDFHTCEAELDRWVELSETIQKNSLSERIDDVLDVLEYTIEPRNLHLFPYAADMWIKIVTERLHENCIGEVSPPEYHSRQDSLLLERRNLSQYFRSKAAGILKTGIERLCSAVSAMHETRDSSVINEIKKHINEHYGDKLSLQNIADTVFMSKNYMANLFKNETGNTIWNYLVCVRMEKAKEFL
ncbi:MAG: response regulator, partial [Spirochaetia bacterium]